MSTRPPFLPVTADVDDDRLERLARDKGVGALVKPAQQPAAPKPSAQTPRAAMKSVNIELPVYVWLALKIRAAENQTSLRHVIMMALKAAGITIAEDDLIEDGRRLR